LIGAGSFGSVFLGMDSHSGLLMAVKQVELGKNRTSARTQGMVDALEREVELLKELQHDNIVQYLGQLPTLPRDSHTDVQTPPPMGTSSIFSWNTYQEDR